MSQHFLCFKCCENEIRIVINAQLYLEFEIS